MDDNKYPKEGRQMHEGDLLNTERESDKDLRKPQNAAERISL
jgi:hypothetical protein